MKDVHELPSRLGRAAEAGGAVRPVRGGQAGLPGGVAGQGRGEPNTQL